MSDAWGKSLGNLPPPSRLCAGCDAIQQLKASWSACSLSLGEAGVLALNHSPVEVHELLERIVAQSSRKHSRFVQSAGDVGRIYSGSSAIACATARSSSHGWIWGRCPRGCMNSGK